MNTQRTNRFTIGVLALVVLLVGIVGAFQWTLIPFTVDGRVTSIGYVDGTAADGPTHHLRRLEVTGGTEFVVSQSFVENAGGESGLKGSTVHKDRWQTVLKVDGHSVALRVPGEFWRTLLALLITVAAGIIVRVTTERSAVVSD